MIRLLDAIRSAAALTVVAAAFLVSLGALSSVFWLVWR